MKRLLLIFAAILCIISFLSCENNEEKTKVEHHYFLSEIRPSYFENLNFNSVDVKKNIPKYLANFKKVYDNLEYEYLLGYYISNSDLENFRLAKLYYSFYMTALVSAYLDGTLTFNEINGTNTIGLYSGLDFNQNNFENIELSSMMVRAEKIVKDAININGYNDRAYGFYVLVNQIQKRLGNQDHKSEVMAHKLALNYTSYNLQNYTQVPVWNLLMPLVVFTDYTDPLNTFENPEMEGVLNTYNTKLIVPGTLPTIGGKYPEILGPLYKFDVNLKKVDWMLRNSTVFTQDQVNELDLYIGIMNTIINYIETQKSILLNTWKDKHTFQMRKDKLNEIKSFRQNLYNPKPILNEFINSNEFKRAYQCYSCHAPSGL